jgi:hypothetical protein
MASEERSRLVMSAGKRNGKQPDCTERIALYDNYDRITDPDNLYQAFKSSKKGISWKESVQRYEASVLRNITKTAYRRECAKWLC